jgi:hypothetical protein
MPSGDLRQRGSLRWAAPVNRGAGGLQLRQLRISVKAPVTPPSVHVPSMTRL